jgi:hypothetical protein
LLRSNPKTEKRIDGRITRCALLLAASARIRRRSSRERASAFHPRRNAACAPAPMADAGAAEAAAAAPPAAVSGRKALQGLTRSEFYHDLVRALPSPPPPRPRACGAQDAAAEGASRGGAHRAACARAPLAARASHLLLPSPRRSCRFCAPTATSTSSQSLVRARA